MSLDPEQVVVLAADYQAGLSLESVAKKYGCTIGTVRNHLVRRGIPRRPPGLRPNPVAPTKVCTSCNQELLRSEFYSGGKHSSECKGCISQKSADKYHGSPEHRRRKIESAGEWQKAHPERHRAQSRKWVRQKSFGWTQEQFDLAWEQQEGRCAICQKEMLREGSTPVSVHADHDHKTGRARALLCAHCNRGLGSFRDSPKTLQAAAEYLLKYMDPGEVG